MRLIGQSLEIKDIGEEDSGEYICEVETFGAPLDQTHTLEVLGQLIIGNWEPSTYFRFHKTLPNSSLPM